MTGTKKALEGKMAYRMLRIEMDTGRGFIIKTYEDTELDDVRKRVARMNNMQKNTDDVPYAYMYDEVPSVLEIPKL